MMGDVADEYPPVQSNHLADRLLLGVMRTAEMPLRSD
jgi:hypothetical protein